MTTNIQYDITVAEFLEYEFKFEMMHAFSCTEEDFPALKATYPSHFKDTGRHVLANVVSPQCRMHMTDVIERVAAYKRLQVRLT
jgi:hypothetical protein